MSRSTSTPRACGSDRNPGLTAIHDSQAYNSRTRLGVLLVESVFRINEYCYLASLLRLSNGMEGQSGLSAALRPKDLPDENVAIQLQ